MIVCASVSFTSAQALEETPRTLILFDRSASMIQPYEGIRKIDLAKHLFVELSARFEHDPQVGVRFFAGGTSGDKSRDCQASEMGLAFEARSSSDLSALVDNVEAVGHQTPITFALDQARTDLAGWAGPRKIILISDGQETCDGDPEELADLLFEEGITIDTIGIGPADAFSQLGMIALSGGGGFRLAENLESLKSALGNALPGLTMDFGAPGDGGTSGQPERASQLDAGANADGSFLPEGVLPLVALPAVSEIELPEFEEAPPGTSLAVEIIFDASGSMAARLGGQTKLALAKDALNAATQGFNSETMMVAFRAYGFDKSVEKTPEASCPNTVLLLPFTNTGQAADLMRQATQLDAYGYTPIARSLELAGQDLATIEAARRMIILISDGEETCGGDPQAVARSLRDQGIDLQTHVVGFDLDDVARRQMSSIAREGGGIYYDASDGAELGASLIRVIDLAQEVADPWDARLIHPVVGGRTLEAAELLDAGTYTLTEHLPKGEERFFKVGTRVAQRALLRAVIQSRKALFDEEGEARESDFAYGGFEIRLYRPDGEEVMGHWARVYGDRGEQAHTGYVDQTGGGFFFSVGNRYDTVNKDALFRLDIDEAGDIAVRQDAAAERNNALPLDASAPAVGHLGLEDREDIYKVALTGAGSELSVTVRFTDPDFRFVLDIRNADNDRRIEHFTKLTREGEASVTLTVPEAVNAVSLSLRDNNPGLDVEFSSYTIVVMQHEEEIEP